MEGDYLQKALETPSRYPGRTRCRALDCLCAQDENETKRYISEAYRICVDRGTSYEKSYYHVRCSESIVDLKDLIPSSSRWLVNHGSGVS